MSDTAELPESLDEWPREDQLEYLENTNKKRELIAAVLEELDVNTHIGHNGTLKKRAWARVLLAVEERDSDE